MRILLDNGHGSNTKGKHSPDKRVMEWKVARELVEMIAANLMSMGYDVHRITPEDHDAPLHERVRRVNEICKQYGAKNCLLISVHLNAAGADGRWHNARGFSSHIARNASANSKRLAKLLWDEAIANGLKGNRYVPSEGYHVQNLAMCRYTNCPAVLTENLFQDNKEDVEMLLTMKGKNDIVRTHIEAIVKYIEQ